MVIPAKAGIQSCFRTSLSSHWIPAFAGMTDRVSILYPPTHLLPHPHGLPDQVRQLLSGDQMDRVIKRFSTYGKNAND